MVHACVVSVDMQIVVVISVFAQHLAAALFDTYKLLICWFSLLFAKPDV
jgi:hypothetical protein